MFIIQNNILYIQLIAISGTCAGGIIWQGRGRQAKSWKGHGMPSREVPFGCHATIMARLVLIR